MEQRDRKVSGPGKCAYNVAEDAVVYASCDAPAVEICTRRGMTVCADHADGGRERFEVQRWRS